MDFGFEIVGAKPKGQQTEPPTSQSMRIGDKIRRSPSTDQKAVRRQLQRGVTKKAGLDPLVALVRTAVRDGRGDWHSNDDQVVAQFEVLADNRMAVDVSHPEGLATQVFPTHSIEAAAQWVAGFDTEVVRPGPQVDEGILTSARAAVVSGRTAALKMAWIDDPENDPTRGLGDSPAATRAMDEEDAVVDQNSVEFLRGAVAEAEAYRNKVRSDPLLNMDAASSVGYWRRKLNEALARGASKTASPGQWYDLEGTLRNDPLSEKPVSDIKVGDHVIGRSGWEAVVTTSEPSDTYAADHGGDGWLIGYMEQSGEMVSASRPWATMRVVGSSKTAGAKSDICPKCGSHMDDVQIVGDVLHAHCDACGWDGSKRRSSASKMERRAALKKMGMSDEAVELKLYLENDGDIYRQQLFPIIKNLENHFKKGRWDHERAITGMGYAVETAAKKYHSEFGSSGPWHGVFTPAIRREVAEAMVNELESEMNSGSFQAEGSLHMATPIYPGNGDVVVVGPNGSYYAAKTGDRAVITLNMYGPGTMSACFGASCFRPADGSYISCSGGPLPEVKMEDLTYAGKTQQRFWKWGPYGPGKDQGVDYMLEVDMWEWTPPGHMASKTASPAANALLQDAVIRFSRGEIELKVGDRFGDSTITDVGDQTVQYIDDDGWSGAMQLLFNDNGVMTPAWQRAYGDL